VAARAAEEFGVDAAALVAEYGPDVPVPVPDEEDAAPARGRGRPPTARRDAEPALLDARQEALAAPDGAQWPQATHNGQQGPLAAPNGHQLAPAAQNGQEHAQAMQNGQERAQAAQNGSQEPRTAREGLARLQAAASAGELQAAASPREEPPAAHADGTAPQAAGNGAGPAPAVRTIPYVRAEQEKRAATAQRQLEQLGKVNPLALEEFAALEERHAFLATQLEDLKKTRRDLLTVVKEVDDRVQQVFASAFQDTAAEFERIFTRLFPGGEGRLVLTEPDDMLATGIDVEARPPGKKVKRLSLLSGGERSLTAIGFLLAIFMARPSPFYVLDEVEAALDDTNLQRLLAICEELRASSQLIIVTHQKRTMEIADALYGTSMQGDGVSAVVSQRLRERERA